MRVEPEQVLEQERVSAERGVKDAEVEEALHGAQDDGDRDHRRAQDHDEAGGVVRPDEQRQAAPGQAGSAHLWMVTMKFRPVKIDEKPAMKTASPAAITVVLVYIVL